mmetsp:Transcript_53036/g.141051  ORF Transcript_53036/g.141051 Transcript_53036/m.141051 type:complete len:239 (-) Transcript_53036:1109-1825(-)
MVDSSNEAPDKVGVVPRSRTKQYVHHPGRVSSSSSEDMLPDLQMHAKRSERLLILHHLQPKGRAGQFGTHRHHPPVPRHLPQDPATTGSTNGLHKHAQLLNSRHKNIHDLQITTSGAKFSHSQTRVPGLKIDVWDGLEETEKSLLRNLLCETLADCSARHSRQRRSGAKETAQHDQGLWRHPSQPRRGLGLVLGLCRVTDDAHCARGPLQVSGDKGARHRHGRRRIEKAAGFLPNAYA